MLSLSFLARSKAIAVRNGDEEIDVVTLDSKTRLIKSPLQPINRSLKVPIDSHEGKQNKTDHIGNYKCLPAVAMNKIQSQKPCDRTALHVITKCLKPCEDHSEKKIKTNTTERRRRTDLRQLYQNLQKLVPTLTQYIRVPRFTILTRAIACCRSLTNDEQTLTVDKQKHIVRNQHLRQCLAEIKQSRRG